MSLDDAWVRFCRTHPALAVQADEVLVDVAPHHAARIRALLLQLAGTARAEQTLASERLVAALAGHLPTVDALQLRALVAHVQETHCDGRGCLQSLSDVPF